MAQVLPEDRADVLYHSFDGDQIQITGPSILLRKKLTKDFSAYANLYIDSISSASIDVRSYASPYEEKRTEVSLGGDYLLGETILSGGVTSSDENDFEARSAYFGISQDIFGGLTTVRLGFARGWDKIGQVTDPSFEEEADRRSYRLGLSQVVTKNFIMTFDFEGITDEGFLNNPYRNVRFRDPTAPDGFLWQPEVYPETRTIFTDTWGVDAWDASLGYTFSLERNWLFDVGYRYYTQGAADFYSDLFDYPDQQNFLARDKELSTFSDQSLRFGVTYDMPVERWGFVKRGTANFNYDYILFKYDDFRDPTAGGVAGEEPLFDFTADVLQLYVSFWF